jgi:hypothetical protein
LKHFHHSFFCAQGLPGVESLLEIGGLGHLIKYLLQLFLLKLKLVLQLIIFLE